MLSAVFLNCRAYHRRGRRHGSRRARLGVLRLGFVLLAIVIAATSSAHAQFTRFQNLADDQGLGDTDVTALAEDDDGHILLGTQSGLYRYDGSEFRQDATGLPGDWIVQITRDRAGRFWVATNQNGLYVGDGSRFERVDLGRSADGADLRSPHSLAPTGNGMIFDSDGAVFLAPTGPDRVGRFAPLFGPATLRAVPALRHARFVAPDGDGGVLIGCGVALCHAEHGQVEIYDDRIGLPDDDWQAAIRAGDGTLWVRSVGRLAWRRPGRPVFSSVDLPGKPGPYFEASPEDLELLPDRKGGVLTEADEGLLRWNGTSWRRFRPHAGGMPPTQITAMLWDREGSLWAGSGGYGVFRAIGLDQWEHWTKEDGIPGNTAWAIARIPGGPLWAATDGGSAALGDGGGAGIPGESLVAAASRGGHLWLSPAAGSLIRIGKDGRSTVRLPTDGLVYAAGIDRDDRLWLGTAAGLVLVPDADAPAARLIARLAVRAKRCQLVVDPSATDWAVCWNGVFRQMRTGDFEPVVRPDALPDQPLTGCFTADGELWLGTRTKGIVRFRVDGHGGAERLPSVNRPAISADDILFMTRTRNGFVWIGTGRGIDRFDGHAWRHFDSGDGPISNDMAEFSVLEDIDGSMWFGTSHGLSHLLDPDGPSPPPPLPPLITSLSVGRSALPIGPSIRTRWSRGALVVRFASLDYVRNRSLVFRYRLCGVDSGWNDTTAHEARYAEVPSGGLRFELQAVDTVHRDASAPVTLLIRISPPWWRLPWFYAICALAAGGVLWAAWQTRVRLLVRQRRRLEQVVSARTEEIEQARRDMERLALSDALTGLPNRRAIMTELEAAVERAASGKATLGVLLCDIDHFKTINDRDGHLAGDEVLAEFGRRLQTAVVAPEAAGRYGGEEFLVLLTGSEARVAERAATVRAALTGTPFDLAAGARVVTASFGLGLFRTGDSVVGLLARADAALYKAKENGRDRIEREWPADAERRHAPSAEARLARRPDAGPRDVPANDAGDDAQGCAASLEGELRAALLAGEFVLHYQPVLDTRRDAVTSCEALLRWRSPTRGFVEPAAFIPFAERIGLMPQIGDWVLRTACREAVAFLDGLRVSVNLSPVQFRLDDLVERVGTILADTGLNPARLELEVTETAIIDDLAAASTVLDRLRSLGLTIALDDFGTGYSSLSFISKLPFDRIKIDRSFVKDLGERPEANVIVRAVLGLSDGLGTAVTAEGVETATQLDMLGLAGCLEVQGFLIGRPCPADELQDWLRAFAASRAVFAAD